MNLTTIKSLFIRYFTENGKKDLGTFGIIVILGIISSYLSFGHGLIACLIVVFYSSRIYKNLAYTASAMHYMLIPASAYEKISVNALLIHIYYPLISLLSYYLGTICGTTLHSLIYHDAFILPELFSYLFKDNEFALFAILSFIVFQAILMFGSIYFKKHAIIKVILIAFLVLIFFFILDVILFQLFAHTGSIFVNNMVSEPDLTTHKVLAILSCIFWILFFWTLTYLKFRETEV